MADSKENNTNKMLGVKGLKLQKRELTFRYMDCKY